MQWASEHRAWPVRRAQDGLRQPGPASVWEDEAVPRRGSPSPIRAISSSSRPRRRASKIYFTPQPLFVDVTTQWAATLQKMVAKEVPVDEGLDQLAASVDEQLKQAGLG